METLIAGCLAKQLLAVIGDATGHVNAPDPATTKPLPVGG